MSLAIDTFSNVTGGQSFFKAVGHPLAVPSVDALFDVLRGANGPVAIYDPLGLAEGFFALYPGHDLSVAGVYVQDFGDLGRALLGQRTQPVTDLPSSGAVAVLIVAFDAARLADHIRHLPPKDAEIHTLDEIRIPDEMLGNPGRYLDPLNFATNFAFFRDGAGNHTRVATANYWAGYGAKGVRLWCRLMDAAGKTLAEWRQALPEGQAGVQLDSKAIRARFGLPEFEGQLFIHAIGVRGHDVVKYAVDTYGDDPAVLSCTHDANAWPADTYAGLPAPGVGERVILWIQNSHPCPVPSGGVGLGRMGRDDVTWLDREIPAFGSYPLDVAELLPHVAWPEQIEVQAGKHFVRPRYEVVSGGNGLAADGKARRRIAHANVQRVDLKPDPRIPEIANLMGKGFLLPAPILKRDRFRSIALPTPMATTQADIPSALICYDASGREIARETLGRLPRDHAKAVDLDQVLNGALPADGWGHMELVYDFSDGGGADGWLHALFRYEDRGTGHGAETSFGAHIFNTVLTYKNEPQSYSGRAPGLSTRLFLRLGDAPQETMCHLIYPASTPWHAESETALVLYDAAGAEVACQDVRIPCGGSLFWRVWETFDPALRDAVAGGGYVLIRDTTCRLFGYHGLDSGAAFSLDHMFGF